MIPPKIVILGCGDIGNDIISCIHRSCITGADAISVNTDTEHLKGTQADKRITIGKALKGGRGAGGCPIMGGRAARNGIPTINSGIESADLVLITAGLGGGTGSGALPLIAESARDNGSLVICFVTIPPETERYPWITAVRALKETLKYADSVIVLDYQKFASQFPGISPREHYQKMDQMIADSIREMTDLVMVPSLINVGLEDLRAIFKNKGMGLLLAGESEDGTSNKNERVRQNSLAHPTADADITGASGCLVCMTGGPDINRFDAEDIATAIGSVLDRHADVVWGLNVKNGMEGKIRVFAFVTGLMNGADSLRYEIS